MRSATVRSSIRALVLAAGLGVGVLVSPAAAQTEFTYQGVLSDLGGPVNGTENIRFRLFDAQSGGNLIAETTQNVDVVDGVFTAPLNLGPLNTIDPSSAWLEPAVSLGGGTFDVLGRQKLTAAPFAMNTRGINVANDGTVALEGPLQLVNPAESTWSIFSGSQGRFGIQDVGTATRLIIDDGGYVGVGISNPNRQLHVRGTDGGILRIDRGNPAGGAGVILDSFFDDTFSNGSRISTWQMLATIDGGLLFRNSAAGADPAMFLDESNNNVGIGVMNPARPLDVGGPISVQGTVMDGSFFEMSMSNTGGGQLVARDLNGNPLNVKLATFGGNVGIGTTNPKNQLHIREGDSGSPVNQNSELLIESDTEASISLVAGADDESSIFFGNPDVGATGAAIVFNPFGGDNPDGLNFRVGQFPNEVTALSIEQDGDVRINSDTTIFRDGTGVPLNVEQRNDFVNTPAIVARSAGRRAIEGYVSFGPLAGTPQPTVVSAVYGEVVTFNTGTQDRLYGGYFLSPYQRGVGVAGMGAFGGNATGVGSIGVYGKSDQQNILFTGGGYDFYADGAGIDYGSPSSKRYKHSVSPIPYALDKLEMLRGVNFTWNEDRGGHPDVGFIAEEVMQVLPEIVVAASDGVHADGMDYTKVSPLIVEAVKQLRAEKDAEIAELRAQLESVEARVDAANASVFKSSLAWPVLGLIALGGVASYTRGRKSPAN